jgi:GNAT superfamily N-acetyltransferase
MPGVTESRTLHDSDGTPIARYLYVNSGGREIADLLELEVPVERAVPVVLSGLKGMRVAGPPELGWALAVRGARVRRHAHVYSHDLAGERAEPDPPPGITLTPVDRPIVDLLPAYRAAFPPGHPDRTERDEEHLSRFELLDASGLAVAADGNVAGAILVADLEGADPPLGGPWIMEVFRDPRYPGAGRALLERALARAEGPTLGLSVTEGNRAERLYRALGFRRVLSSVSVDL